MRIYICISPHPKNKNALLTPPPCIALSQCTMLVKPIEPIEFKTINMCIRMKPSHRAVLQEYAQRESARIGQRVTMTDVIVSLIEAIEENKRKEQDDKRRDVGEGEQGPRPS